MKILITSDFHFRKKWFEWLTQEAPKYDLVCLSGDLLNLFDKITPRIDQIQWVVQTWKPQFAATKTLLAISSGNHDFNDEPALQSYEDLNPEAEESLREIVAAKSWMDLLKEPNQIISDKETQIVTLPTGEKIILSTIPDNFYENAETLTTQNKLWETGANLKLVHELPWIVLNHQPPAHTRIGSGLGCARTLNKIKEYKPTYVICGHEHDLPYLNGYSFIDHINKTTCFNAGQSLLEALKWITPPVPNHIVLDLKKKEAVWTAFHPLTKTYQTGKRSLNFTKL
jgi:Icc-related predicted phosphoesterase